MSRASFTHSCGVDLCSHSQYASVRGETTIATLRITVELQARLYERVRVRVTCALQVGLPYLELESDCFDHAA